MSHAITSRNIGALFANDWSILQKSSVSFSLSLSLSVLKSTSYSARVHLARDISVSRSAKRMRTCRGRVRSVSSPFLRVGDYFGTITLFRGLSDTDGATIPRQTLRGRNGDPESFSGRPVPWQCMIFIGAIFIYIYIFMCVCMCVWRG